MGRVREVSLGAYDHQELPFEKLVEELQPERHLSHSPLVQVMFQVLNFVGTGLLLAGLEVVPLTIPSQRVRFDLEMTLWQQPKPLRGSVSYSTDLFDRATIERFVSHFLNVLDSVVADADLRMSEVSLLSREERQQMLVEWNDTTAAYSSETCLHELFEAQVARTPDATAVVFGESMLTFRALEERANHIAHQLREMGAKPGALVGVCVERSLDLVATLLAVLKSGAAYVPLDEAYPADRLAYILEDAAVAILVADDPVLTNLRFPPCQVLSLDRDAQMVERQPATRPDPMAGPTDLAYVTYTSGSTGKPKGVQIEHRSAVNFVQAMAERPGLSADDVLLAVTTVAFDIAVLELFVPMHVGARVALASRETACDPRCLAARTAPLWRHHHAGDTRHVERADRVRVDRDAGTQGAVRWGGHVPGSRRAAPATMCGALEHVWADGDHRVVDLLEDRRPHRHRCGDAYCEHVGLHLG